MRWGRAKKTEYKGELYDSGAEAHRASVLELMRLAGKIAWWRRGDKQSLIDLGPGKRVTYKPDFIVCDMTEQRWAEDVKGTKVKNGRTIGATITREFRVKALLWEQRFPNLPLRVVDQEGEVIWPAQKKNSVSTLSSGSRGSRRARTTVTVPCSTSR